MLTTIQETGVATAIQCIYRDLDYAKSLIKAKAAVMGQPQTEEEDDEDLTEESWTFIGDDSDRDIAALGKQPRVSMDLSSMQGIARRGIA